MKLWETIKSALLKNPNQIMCEKTAEMSFEELMVYSESFAQKLSGEKCCAILCGSEMAAAMSLLACFAAKVTAVPLSVRYGQLHCNKILDWIRPTAIISDCDGELRVIRLPQENYWEPEERPALIMCTSGTTGNPKGVMLSEKNIMTNVKDIVSYFKFDSTDSILIVRPLYHCATLTGEFLTAIYKGAKIRFSSDPFNPKQIIDLVEQTGITVFCGTPTLLRLMARFHRNHTSGIRVIAVSGECMGEETGKEIAKSFPDAMIYHVYGLTEACPRVSYLPPELFAKHADSVGFPLDSVQLKIVNTDGTKAKIGETGILWVKGDNVMMGYYHSPEQTVKVMQNGWLCTMDMAVIDEHGLLKIKGRSDDLIIKAGINIYPQEVESELKTDPRVHEALVYPIVHPVSGTNLGLKIVGDFSDPDEVKRLCSEILPVFQIPSLIELVSELPKNGSGKIIRRG